MQTIVKSGKKNWTGKGFSDGPAKVYDNFEDAVAALLSYHFFTYDNQQMEYVPCDKKNRIEFIPLTPARRKRLLLSSGS